MKKKNTNTTKKKEVSKSFIIPFSSHVANEKEWTRKLQWATNIIKGVSPHFVVCSGLWLILKDNKISYTL
jgi:hypothetical protein